MTSADTAHAARARVTSFRPDIEGLRAIAIGLVLISHAGVRQLPGGFIGVDVFFVISGFLITGLLTREMEVDGTISLRRFYARRAKRLLPAAGAVLAVTAVLTWWSATVVDWRTFGWDIVGAATYVVNWVLAGRSVDYLAEDVGASPVQHFWSLAVEEQFYIVWPLLLVLVGWICRRRRLRIRPAMAWTVLLLMLPSFAWSVHLSETNSEVAFFVTTTRLWELGIGALVAIGATQWRRIPVGVASATGWAGLTVIVVSGFAITPATTWPGSAALLPTVGTAAVIVSGFAGGNRGPATLLSWRPAVWVGGLSYSLYLWHWPLLIAATARWGELGAKRGLLVVLFAIVPAYVSYRFLENPIRFSPRLRRSALALSVGANFSLLGVVAGLLLIAAVPSTTVGDQGGTPGADVLGDAATASDAPPGSVESLATVSTINPSALEATSDIPISYADECSVGVTSDGFTTCEYGDPAGDTVIAVVGDSKVQQWQSALDAIAHEHDWRMVYFLKSACAFASALQVANGEVNTSCSEWNEKAFEAIVDLNPDVVITSQRHGVAPEDAANPTDRQRPAMELGLTDTWGRLGDAGIPVIALLDNPSPNLAVHECVAEHPEALELCTFDREAGVESSAAPTQRAAAASLPNVQVIDLTEWICPDDQCVPVIGDVLVYRQGSHLTDTFVRSLTPPLANELELAVAALSVG